MSGYTAWVGTPRMGVGRTAARRWVKVDDAPEGTWPLQDTQKPGHVSKGAWRELSLGAHLCDLEPFGVASEPVSSVRWAPAYLSRVSVSLKL